MSSIRKSTQNRRNSVTTISTNNNRRNSISSISKDQARLLAAKKQGRRGSTSSSINAAVEDRVRRKNSVHNMDNFAVFKLKTNERRSSVDAINMLEDLQGYLTPKKKKDGM